MLDKNGTELKVGDWVIHTTIFGTELGHIYSIDTTNNFLIVTVKNRKENWWLKVTKILEKDIFQWYLEN